MNKLARGSGGHTVALEKVKGDAGSWNKRLATLRREQEATLREMSPPKVPQVKAA